MTKKELQVRQLDAILDFLSEPVIIYGTDAVAQYANQAAIKIYGFNPAGLSNDEVVQKIKLRHTDGSDISQDDLPSVRALKGERVERERFILTKTDGTELIVETSAAPLTVNGNIEATVLLWYDVSALQESEEALREAREKAQFLSGIIETSEQPFAYGYPDGRFGYVNPAFAKLTGYSQKELLAGTILSEDLTPSEWRQHEAKVLETLHTTCEPQRYEKEYIRKDGTRVPLEVFMHLICDEKGEPQTYYAFVTDITERKRAEKELKKVHEELEERVKERTAELENANVLLKEQVEKRTRAEQDISESRRQVLDILESISDGFFALDSLWRFTYINGRAQQLLGLSKVDVLFKKVWDSLPNAQVLRLFKELNQSAERKSTTSFEEFLPHLDKWFEFHVYPYEQGISVYFSDITKRKQTERLNDAINEINTSISSTLDFDAIMEKVKVKAAEALSAEAATISRREDGLWVTRHVYNFPEEVIGKGFTDEEAPISVLIAKAEEVLVIDDALNDSRVNRQAMEQYGVRSILAVPIMVQETVIGVFSFLYFSEPVTFTKAQVDFAGKLAAVVSLALENVRLFEAERDTAETLETMMERTNALVAYLDARFNFVMVNSSYVKGSGHTKEELIGHNHFDLFPNAENEVIFTKVRDTGQPIEYKAKPFEYADQPWRGVTYWDWTLTPVKEPSGRVIGLVLSLVDVTAIIQSKQLSDALNDINAALNSTLNAEEIIQKAMVEGSRALGTDATVIYLREGGYWVLKHAHGPADLKEAVGLKFTDEQAKTMALSADSTEPVVVNGAKLDERVDRKMMEQYDIGSFLQVPLLTRGSTVGVIIYSYLSTPTAFTEAQIDFARKLAASVSLAIENALLYESQRRIANVLQGALLTVPERIEGLEFGHLYHSATEAAKVGGDFYDIFAIEHGKIGILIGDVSGKGVNAAAITATVKNAIKAHTFEDENPSQVVSRTNDLVVKVSPANIFVTLFYGILDIQTGELEYCSAGHPPAIIKRSSGTIDLLEARSPAVGAFKGLQYSNGAATLRPEDTLVLYTDGVTEVRCDDSFFGEQKLIDVIEGLGSVSAEQVPELIFDEVFKCSGGNLSDDLALLVVSLKGE